MPAGNIQNFSNKEISNHYKKYIYLYRLFHLKNTPPWWFGSEYVENELKKHLSGSKYGDLETVFQILISGSEYISENLAQELSLLDICILLYKRMYKNFKKIPSVNNLLKNSARFHLAIIRVKFGMKNILLKK